MIPATLPATIHPSHTRTYSITYTQLMGRGEAHHHKNNYSILHDLINTEKTYIFLKVSTGIEILNGMNSVAFS